MRTSGRDMAQPTHGSVTGNQTHKTWLPDEQQTPEQTINYNMKIPTVKKTERGPRAHLYPALPLTRVRISHLTVLCDGKTIFTKSIRYLNQGIIYLTQKAESMGPI